MGNWSQIEVRAVLSQQGVFNHSGQPALPSSVAKFIQAVLEKASAQDYSTIDWDFRIDAHRQKILADEKTMPTVHIRAKL